MLTVTQYTQSPFTDYDHPSGGHRPSQIPRLDTPQASKESHNLIHNRIRVVFVACRTSGYRTPDGTALFSHT